MPVSKYNLNSSEINEIQLQEEFMTQEQRMEAASEILAAITLRILKKRHANHDHSSQI